MLFPLIDPSEVEQNKIYTREDSFTKSLLEHTANGKHVAGMCIGYLINLARFPRVETLYFYCIVVFVSSRYRDTPLLSTFSPLTPTRQAQTSDCVLLLLEKVNVSSSSAAFRRPSATG